MARELILTVGLPCSGKSLFSRYLQGIKKNLFRVSTRDIFKMVDSKYREEHVPKYLVIQELLVLRLLEFGSVIVDNMNLTARERASVIRPTKLVYNDLQVTFYQMSRTLDHCKKDNQKRPIIDNDGFFQRVPDNVMDELYKGYELPQLSEDVNVINGVKWEHSDAFKIGNLTVNHKPKIFDIAAKKVTHVVDKPQVGPSTITMSDDD